MHVHQQLRKLIDDSQMLISPAVVLASPVHSGDNGYHRCGHSECTSGKRWATSKHS